MAKKILSEAQVRRFAKLANLSPINEMNSMYEEEEEAAEMDAPMDDVAADAELEGDAEMDAEVDAEMGGDDLEDRKDMVSKVVQAVADALDVEVKVEDDLEGGEELEGGLEDAELEGDVEAELGAPEGEEALEDEEVLAEALKGINYVPGRKEIVNEVAKRVAQRLLKAKKADSQLKEALGNQRRSRRTTRRRK